MKDLVEILTTQFYETEAEKVRAYITVQLAKRDKLQESELTESSLRQIKAIEYVCGLMLGFLNASNELVKHLSFQICENSRKATEAQTAYKEQQRKLPAILYRLEGLETYSKSLEEQRDRFENLYTKLLEEVYGND